MMMRRSAYLSLLTLLLLAGAPLCVSAQEQPPAAPSAQQAPEQMPEQAPEQPAEAPEQQPAEAAPAAPQMSGEGAKGAPVFDQEKFGSLVFTTWEYAAIQDMKRSIGAVRTPEQSELERALKTRQDQEKKVKPPPEERELRLGGIVYHGNKDWTIWLNEKRITPDALPTQIMELKVYKTYVEMKWYDDWSNQIYPIRLRPHQRFNLDARMFLPG